MKEASLAVARRYAEALLDLAQKDGSTDELARQLHAAAALLLENHELMSALAHPAISAERKKKIARAVWSGAGVPELFLRFLDLLVDNRRIGIIQEIEESFLSQRAETRNVVSGDVTTAVKLDDHQTQAIAKALEAATGLTVELRAFTDPALLGGVLVKVAGRSYDGTVVASLRALREHLAGA